MREGREAEKEGVAQDWEPGEKTGQDGGFRMGPLHPLERGCGRGVKDAWKHPAPHPCDLPPKKQGRESCQASGWTAEDMPIHRPQLSPARLWNRKGRGPRPLLLGEGSVTTGPNGRGCERSRGRAAMSAANTSQWKEGSIPGLSRLGSSSQRI